MKKLLMIPLLGAAVYFAFAARSGIAQDPARESRARIRSQIPMPSDTTTRPCCQAFPIGCMTARVLILPWSRRRNDRVVHHRTRLSCSTVKISPNGRQPAGATPVTLPRCGAGAMEGRRRIL